MARYYDAKTNQSFAPSSMFLDDLTNEYLESLDEVSLQARRAIRNGKQDAKLWELKFTDSGRRKLVTEDEYYDLRE